MLSDAEKAYYDGLVALEHKDYRSAADLFEKAAVQFAANPEFVLVWESIRLLLRVKEELAGRPVEAELEISETYS